MQTFVVIMGSGRCGSTATISFLNKHKNFNIYGENNGVICSLLKNVSRLRHLSVYKNLSHKQSNSTYRISSYIGSEWYNPKDKIDMLENILIKFIIDYFDKSVSYIGFKEIRWNKDDIEALTILQKYYNMKYVHLTRNIEEQASSIKKAGWNTEDPISYISETNQTISNFLKKQNPKNYINKNISTDINFQQKIYDFIVKQDKNFSNLAIDSADD